MAKEASPTLTVVLVGLHRREELEALEAEERGQARVNRAL
jgi:hypothetical protein